MRRLGDGGEGHDGERHTGNVIEKGAQECAFYLAADEGERDDANGERHETHEENVDVNIMLHRGALLSLPGRKTRRDQR